MKSLQEFIAEQKSMRQAARMLGKHAPTVYKWSKSGKEYFVIKKNGRHQLLEVK